MRVSVLLVFSVIYLVPAAAQSQPSFECGQHHTRTERAICADETLASLDRLLSDIYARLRQDLNEHEFGRLRSEQRRWIAARNRCGAGAQCIASSYRQRIQDLQVRLRTAVASSSDTAGPSFDCSRASSSVDRAICANPEIAQLDVELANLYSWVRRSLSTEMSAEVLREQRAWLRRRNTCGPVAVCLLQRYRDRIAELTASAPADDVTRVVGAQTFTRDQCTAVVSRLRQTTANVNVRLIGQREGVAGEPIQLTWQTNTKHITAVPVFLIVDTPEAVRFSGKNFVPFTPGAKAPYGATQARDRVRAFIPLDRPDNSRGQLAVRFLRAGPQTIRWRVIVTGTCGEHLINAGKEWRIDAGLGQPSAVVQNRFESRKPQKVYRDKFKGFELRVFPEDFTVHSAQSQDPIFHGVGTSPQFSPTGRFLTYSEPRMGETLVVDLLDGAKIASVRHDGFIWLRDDSLLLAAGSFYGQVSLSFLLREGGGTVFGGAAPRRVPGTAARVTLDLNTLTAALNFRETEEALDLALLSNFSTVSGPIDTRRHPHLSAVLRRHRARAKTSIPVGTKLVDRVDWDLGEPIRQAAANNALIDQTDRDVARPGRLARRSRQFGLSMPRSIEALDMTGIFQRIHQTIVPLIANVKVEDEAFDTDPYTRALEYSASRNRSLTRSMLNRIFASVPAARSRFYLGRPEDGWKSDKIETGFIKGVWSWGPKGDETFVVLYYSVAGTLNVRHGGILIINRNARKPVWELREELMASTMGDGEGPLGWEAIERLILVVRPLPDNKVAIATSAGRTAAVFDIPASRQVGKTIELDRPALIDGLQLTNDQRFVVTARIDGTFEFRSIRDGSFLFSGAYVDDELIVMLPDGRYDATYEGAQAYRLRFQGSERLFSIDQFNDALHRPGLAQNLLAGREVESASKRLHVPPTLKIAATSGGDGMLEIRAQIGGARANGKVLLYQDGALTDVVAFAEGQTEVSARIRRRQEAHLLSAVAVSSDGSRSVVQSAPVPGEPAPARSQLHAVVVGIDDYEMPAFEDLEYARHDAETLAAALSSELKIAYDLAQLEFLRDREATPKRILDAINDAVRDARTGDTILVFFAGHGTKSEAGAFELVTTNSTLPWDAIARKLESSRARVIVLLDACHSGQAERTLAVTPEEAVSAAAGGSGPPMLVLAAAKGRQFSIEAPNAKGGAFTQTLAHFLGAGRKSIDRNGNGRLEISEIYGNLKVEVMRLSMNQQTPWLVRRNLVGDFPIF